MPVSLSRPDWCPETSDGCHSGTWYEGAKCAACGQDGPEPDDYLWPDQSGPLFPDVAPQITPQAPPAARELYEPSGMPPPITWRADDWTGRPYDPEDPGPAHLETPREDGDWDDCEPKL